MSSSLNLSPDLPVICVQAGLFLANMIVVKKLIMEPYLKVRASRDQATTGNLGTAEKLDMESKKMDQEIALKMQDAHRKAAKVRETQKNSALEKRALKISEAEDFSKKEFAKIQIAIAENLAQESAKKADSISQLAGEFVQSATH